ncbi:efflux RND transporter periplasmic adaptor subunit [Aureibacter tunicatorum]|uniref:Membrane fusion protein (Multidrug efflux system) n=1 Tax=Aureibacter tunicatorum TaxID=866807 RepID=A0AAE3XT79_9BACT|nr:efflux RND transporter periplasmic adaptor subunit [Aureibacter tunicatorum]MDR6241574.1 membrane fusion protein (multidrug efflux system) [Aureibacter tunicatorum]BDD07202.1 MexE family multidrug efflux RND transporter periplasmic adaptor subunit [Aureibacter tunicatorum]
MLSHSFRKNHFFWIFLLTLGLFSCKKNEQKALPPSKVEVVKIKIKDVPIYKEFVGQVYGQVDIPIRARVDGYLEGLYFDEGRKVKKGQLLYSIDAQPFEAEVAQMESQLAEAKIRLIKSKNDLDRYIPLAEINAVSQSDLDAVEAEYGAAQEAVKAAQASLRIAKINLSYTRIHSPINGLIGRTKAKVGEYVGRDPNPVILNQVSEIDTILVQFFITEKDYLLMARRYIVEGETPASLSEVEEDEVSQSTDLSLILADGSTFEYKGKFDFLDREVDPTTGSILVQASFPNPINLIRPGQFAKVKANVEDIEGAYVIPQKCVVSFQGKNFVYVVGKDNQVEQKSVTLGPNYKDYSVVLTGLESTDMVVVEGLQKVRIGATVNPVEVEFKSNYVE